MKTAVNVTRPILPPTKRRTQDYSKYIYKAHKEVSPSGMRNPDLRTGRPQFPKPVLLRLVSSEASRLSKANRLKVITRQEVNAAVAHVQRRIHARAAA